MFSAKKWIFSQFLSATILPPVARVSAPSTTPSLKIIPTIVVPVFVSFGFLNPFCNKNSLLILAKRMESKNLEKFIGFDYNWIEVTCNDIAYIRKCRKNLLKL